MKFKIYFIGLLFMVFFSLSAFGQINQNRSLSELRKDLQYYQNVVKAENMWFCISYKVGFRNSSYSTVLLPRRDAIRRYINFLHGIKIWNHDEIHRLVDDMHRYSDKIKFYIKRDTIPQLQHAIASRTNNYIKPIIVKRYDPQPVNNYTPKTCRSFSKRSYWTGDKNDRVRWHCTYWGSHRLQSETQYVEGKKHGPSVSYFSDGKMGSSYNYWNGYRDGVGKLWLKNKNTYYLLRKTIYRRGKTIKVTQWYSNGNVESVLSYYSNGKLRSAHSYSKNGKLKYYSK